MQVNTRSDLSRTIGPVTNRTLPVRFGGQFKRSLLGTAFSFLGLGLSGANTGCVSYNRLGKVPTDTFLRRFEAPPKQVSNENNVQECDNSHVQNIRNKFNATGDLELLNEFLPYRGRLVYEKDKAKITADSAALAKIQVKLDKLDKMTHYLANHPAIEYWFYDEANKKLHPLDQATIYLLAATLADFMHNRPDLVEKLIKDSKPWINIVTKNVEEGIAGRFQHFAGNIEYKLEALWRGANSLTDGSRVEVHEVMHKLDRAKFLVLSEVDGIPPGFTATQTQQFYTEQDRLSKLNTDYQAELLRDSKSDKPNPTGLRDYAFTRRLLQRYGTEFLPETTESWYEVPRYMKTKSPVHYAILSNYFRIDPADNYRDMEPGEELPVPTPK